MELSPWRKLAWNNTGPYHTYIPSAKFGSPIKANFFALFIACPPSFFKFYIAFHSNTFTMFMTGSSYVRAFATLAICTMFAALANAAPQPVELEERQRK